MRKFITGTLGLLLLTLLMGATGWGQETRTKKVFVITDLEGVSGIFNLDLQCNPYQSPRFEESRKLLTGEVNAAVEGLFEGGATDVVVWDGHDGARTFSVLDIHPQVRLLTGIPVALVDEINPSFNAVIFVGQHAMAGAEKGILAHSYDHGSIQNIWVNNMPLGETGARVMLAGFHGIPAIMLSGDAAACKEFLQLVPNAECAEVKSGISWSAGYMLPHERARGLIREKARRAMERLSEIKPYRIGGPVEVKVEFTTAGVRQYRSRSDVLQAGPRIWIFRGNDIVDAWLKFSNF